MLLLVGWYVILKSLLVRRLTYLINLVSGSFVVSGCGYATVYYIPTPSDRPLQMGQKGYRRNCPADPSAVRVRLWHSYAAGSESVRSLWVSKALYRNQI